VNTGGWFREAGSSAAPDGLITITHQYSNSLHLTEVKDATILGTLTDVELSSLHDDPENSIVERSREVHPE
jgi:hypothetical protein